MQNVIKPLERSGYEVDVFASYYACPEHVDWPKQLLSWYNDASAGKKRVVNSTTCFLHPDTDTSGRSPQGSCIDSAFKLLEHEVFTKKKTYALTLVWRWDVVRRPPGH